MSVLVAVTAVSVTIKSHGAADEGGRALAEMLGHNQTLKKLLLSSNLLGIRYPYIEALYCYLSTSPSC